MPSRKHVDARMSGLSTKADAYNTMKAVFVDKKACLASNSMASSSATIRGIFVHQDFQGFHTEAFPRPPLFERHW